MPWRLLYMCKIYCVPRRRTFIYLCPFIISILPLVPARCWDQLLFGTDDWLDEGCTCYFNLPSSHICTSFSELSVSFQTPVGPFGEGEPVPSTCFHKKPFPTLSGRVTDTNSLCWKGTVRTLCVGNGLFLKGVGCVALCFYFPLFRFLSLFLSNCLSMLSVLPLVYFIFSVTLFLKKHVP